MTRPTNNAAINAMRDLMAAFANENGRYEDEDGYDFLSTSLCRLISDARHVMDIPADLLEYADSIDDQVYNRNRASIQLRTTQGY